MSASIFKKRRQDLLETLTRKTKNGIAVIASGYSKSRSYPSDFYPFSQDVDFLWYTGLETLENAFLLFDCKKQSISLHVDKKDNYDGLWEQELDISEITKTSGLDLIETNTEKLHKSLSKKTSRIHLLPWGHLPLVPIGLIAKVFANSKMIPKPSKLLMKAIFKQRRPNSETEIRLLEDAADIAYDIQDRIKNTLETNTGVTDIKAWNLIHSYMLELDTQPSFPPIVSQSNYLHPKLTGEKLKPGPIIIDLGVRKNGYASDTTRTIMYGKPGVPATKRFKEIEEIVHDAHRNSIHMLKPGVEFKEVHEEASITILMGLIRLGIINKEKADQDFASHTEMYDAGLHTLVFPHGLGHLVKMCVHGFENFPEDLIGYGKKHKRSKMFGTKNLRFARKLKEGDAITIEPGIYVNSSWLNKPELAGISQYYDPEKLLEYNGMVYRHEDTCLVTRTGSRILGIDAH